MPWRMIAALVAIGSMAIACHPRRSIYMDTRKIALPPEPAAAHDEAEDRSGKSREPAAPPPAPSAAQARPQG